MSGRLLRIAARIASPIVQRDVKVHPRTKVYKYIDGATAKTIRGIPGYVLTSLVPGSGMAYINVMGADVPFYTFEVAGLVEWPGDDIVGIQLDDDVREHMSGMGQLPSRQAYRRVVEIIESGRESADWNEYVSLVRTFKPGWAMTNPKGTGAPGEGIVNVPVDMRLLDGEELLAVMEKLGWDPAESVRGLRGNGAPYDWPTILAGLSVSEDAISGPESSWDWGRIEAELAG